jgi:hypothetical protein
MKNVGVDMSWVWERKVHEKITATSSRLAVGKRRAIGENWVAVMELHGLEDVGDCVNPKMRCITLYHKFQ